LFAQLWRALDPSLLVESRASPPGWTGETPVPPPYDSLRGYGTRIRLGGIARHKPLAPPGDMSKRNISLVISLFMTL
jgi:hypothetical protein